MNETRAKSDRLWRMIEDAQRETDRGRANAIFREAEKLGRELHAVEPFDAEFCYAIALTYYHRRAAPEECRKCFEWLRMTEERAPAHPWVPLFLGYQFFDDAHYARAIAEFKRVDQQYFASIDQDWRNIKTDELMLVALILGNSSPIEFKQLEQLTDRFLRAEESDRPVPTELVRALASPANRDRFTGLPKDVAAQVARLIRGCNHSDVFADELALLDTAARAAD